MAGTEDLDENERQEIVEEKKVVCGDEIVQLNDEAPKELTVSTDTIVF